jgi:hypothetical protein
MKHSRDEVVAMDDPYEIALAMLGLALAAVMLVAGGLYLATQPESNPDRVLPLPTAVSRMQGSSPG